MPDLTTGNTFGFLLTDTSRLFRQHFEKTVAENGLGLTPGEIRALGFVIRFRGARQAILAERMGVEPMTLSAYLDRLESRKLILRTMDPSDRRAKLIEPTDDAFRIFQELDPLFDRIYAFATRGLSREAVDAAAEVLRQIRSNLTSDPLLNEPVDLLHPQPPGAEGGTGER
ncbi:MarR family transcriptional regulator [Aureimonas sp. ME7]|uniref:MarR family winged helix-turn-helix transcriptional regulator n=1 Tax=Aureimonas sp. ME7 TaxID=2744252 RepID=UPI001FCE7387|nr:MarR family transcriptional regulator [Aureimonas sp. ME7]